VTALAIALGFLGLLAFAGFVLWLRAREPRPMPRELADVQGALGTLTGKVQSLEEWKSNVNLAQGLRRKPEDRAS
jgi:hypothetical protein